VSPKNNTLLASLSDDDYSAITSDMALVSLTKGQTLFQIGEQPSHVHFPVGAIVSMMNDTPDGHTVEAHMLGKNCMVGVGAVTQPSFYRAAVRSSGLAYRLPVKTLLDARSRCPSYMNNAQEAMRRTMRQLAQNLICTKNHTVDQQVARWMLVTLDLSLSQEILITHQELADLLGFRREAITRAVGRLEHLQSIALHRGVVTLLDRRQLEAESCDCYWHGQDKNRPAAPLGL